MMDPYQKIVQFSKKTALFTSIAEVLEWDQETNMPKEAIHLRSLQHELLAQCAHKELTSSEFAKSLEALIDLETGEIFDTNLSHQKQAALREWRRDYLCAVKLPSTFIKEFAKTTSTSIHVWQECLPKNDFKTFQPYLEKIVQLNQKKAEFLGYKQHPYDALIDSFEPNMTTEKLTILFERLKIPLMNLLKKIQTKKDPEKGFLSRQYPHDKQVAFGKQLLKDMGFTDGFSRLDESTHPMCMTIHPKDIRMTTKIYPNHVITNILSCAHEGGHGLYYSHLPTEFFGTPLCESASLGIDESQSRMWETLIARSFPFWQHYFPKLRNTFPDQLKTVHLEDFYKAINIVEPSVIRVDSDEISYHLHILLRYEIEKGLIDHTILSKDIPDIWNEKMRSYLSITPKAHSEGCLQDIHWSFGAFGYFPTYTLGNLYASQFFTTFGQEHPNWKERIAQGDLQFLSDWQKEKIHRFGREFLPEKLCEKVTGEPLSEKPFIEYLNTKYTSLYHL